MTRARAVACALAVALWSTPHASAAGSLPRATPTPAATASAPDLYVHGLVLAIAHGYLVFTTGDAVRLGPATVVPKGTTLGSYVRAAIDQTTATVRAIELEPSTEGDADIDATQLPRQYAAANPNATAAPHATSAAASGEGAGVSLSVRVPASTPIGDDVYVATDRSNFSPSEIRMTRVDAQHFTATMRLPSGTTLHYEYTRGTFATLERTRIGGIVDPRALPVVDGAHASDTVARWADTS